MGLGLRARFQRWLRDRADEVVLRWLFRAVVAATLVVVATDVVDAVRRSGDAAGIAALLSGGAGTPLSRPDLARPAQRDAHRGPPRPRDDQLAAAMSFDLIEGGRLMASGTIAPGTADAFAAELEKRGSYVKTVVLHSPGGSISDAVAMGQMIRARSLATEVETGRYCASSCPLVFAGGIERRAGDRAAIGVHQVFAPDDGAATPLSVAGAQRVSAECAKYLRQMGVDLTVWMHAMETPPGELFYFTPEEMLALKLATRAAGGASASAVAPGHIGKPNVADLTCRDATSCLRAR